MIRSWLWCVILLAGSVQAAETPIRAWNLLLDHPIPPWLVCCDSPSI